VDEGFGLHKVVGKYISRMRLCFSDTKETIKVSLYE
jgi:hypothetical protein